MKVLHMTRTIELTQSEATKASKPGSDAYKDLNKILSDFPSYEITIAKPKKSSAVFKGMDCSFMEEYISRHDETGEKMEAYKKEFIQFLSISRGSCQEVLSQIYRAYDVQYITEDEFVDMKQNIHLMSVMLHNLLEKLKQSEIRGTKYHTTPH